MQLRWIIRKETQIYKGIPFTPHMKILQQRHVINISESKSCEWSKWKDVPEGKEDD